MDENSGLSQESGCKPRKKGHFGQYCALLFRWAFIVLFAAMLAGGLYFRAPWRVLIAAAILLALLTVVPKKVRKYGWLAAVAGILAITVWMFVPEKSGEGWKIYSFDAELAELEAQRAVLPQQDAAPLYESLFAQWKRIEESDPYPEKADAEDVTQSRPWTTAEFPETAAWLERHSDFFRNLVAAAEKPVCFFPAAVTPFDLTKSMERLSPIKKISQHLIRVSQLDIGEGRSGGWQKQLAVLNMGKHINQQPLMIDILVGIAVECLAREALLDTLTNKELLSNLTSDDILVIKARIQASHFEHGEKLKQILAYEKLFAKNTYGMFYEINSQGEIRFSRFKTMLSFVHGMVPKAQPQYSYWKGVGWKFSRLTFWFSGLSDPEVISEWTDEAYRPLEKVFQTQGFEPDQLDCVSAPRFELNYQYVIRRTLQIIVPSFKAIQDNVLLNTYTRKKGTELFCDLALYNKQHERYPAALNELWSSDEKKQMAAAYYSGFLYLNADNGFTLYHIGQNGIDEGGHHRMPGYDPNEMDYQVSLARKPKPDDILIWPKKLQDDE